ncbi:RHS repeat protein, partial [Stenotrophomonas sp. MYb238]|uniref:RHS repeat domain-containing protein n=1 Tax=Stenotrophomonas sp. MYb238 TaxID=2040281 RepID=UPI0013244A50
MSKQRICPRPLPLLASLLATLLPVTASAQSYSRTEVITYHDNTSKWVLGQVASRTVNGTVVESTTFSASTAQPLTYSSFGKLQQTLTYNADGTVATVKDGNNNQTTLSSWKRGIPQSIGYPDGKSRSAVVNDSGWITQVTDENGYATSYSYDAMGRLASIA